MTMFRAFAAIAFACLFAGPATADGWVCGGNNVTVSEFKKILSNAGSASVEFSGDDAVSIAKALYPPEAPVGDVTLVVVAALPSSIYGLGFSADGCPVFQFDGPRSELNSVLRSLKLPEIGIFGSMRPAAK